MPLSHALKQIRRSRPLSVAVIAIMALCIGSCVAVFAIVKAVLLVDWGYDEPQRIGTLWHARPAIAGVIGVGPSDYMSYRSSLSTIERIGAVTTRGFNLGGGTSTRVTCARMTSEIFPILAVHPSRGRWFSADDDRPASRVVVISERLWRARTGGAGDPVGSSIILDGIDHRVVGMMPESFEFPPPGIQSLASADCWLPAGYTPAELAMPSFNYVLFARLKQGVSIEQANADAHAGAQRIWATYPAAVQSQIVPLQEQALSGSRTPLALFGAAVVGLLLIGCANVSNLVLSGIESRRAELAVRASLGATRRTLMMQVLSESIVLAMIGGLAGVAIASGFLSAMIAANAEAFPRLADARIDGGAIAFAIACGVVAGILGAQPAFLPSQALAGAHNSRAVARGFGRGVRGVLIALEVALAVALLVAAGVLGRSMMSLNAIDAGFNPRDLVTLAVALPEAGHPSRGSILAFSGEVVRRLGDIPGVSAAAAASAAPIGEASPAVVFAQGSGTPDYRPSLLHVVSPEYARSTGLRMRQGRFLESTDTGSGTTAAVINETLARTLFPDGTAVGRAFQRLGSTRPHTIVGVVADVRQAGPRGPSPPAVYVTFAQAEQPVRTLHFLIRSRLSMATLAPRVRRAVGEVDAALPPFGLRSGADLLNGTIATQRFNMLVVAVFAVLAFALAMCGLYAVLSHSVHQARRDAGIRMALGATAARIVGVTIGRALAPAFAGVAAGIAIAAAASGWLASLVFGVKPDDPMMFLGVAALVLIASTIAVLIPALRATRVDLVSLLRYE